MENKRTLIRTEQLTNKLLNLPKPVLILLVSIFLFACGGGGGSSSSSEDTPTLTASQPALSFSTTKRFDFTWTDSDGAEFYRLFENNDSGSGFVQIGSDIPQGEEIISIYVPLYKRMNARYILQTCNISNCLDSDEISVDDNLTASVGYIKSGKPEVGDYFGRAISLSGDGNTLAVGAYSENSSGSGINSDDVDNDAIDSGAVYIFTREQFNWSLQASIKSSNPEENDSFGYALSLSTDGSSLVVGAYNEDSNARGIDGVQTNNLATNSGAAYVFVRSEGNWTQQAYLKSSNSDAGDNFGKAVSISGDAKTIVVGAETEASQSSGINGDETSNGWSNSGAVYVFTKSGNSWQQQAYVKASNTLASSLKFFGKSVDLSDDGNTLAVGAKSDPSSATGVNGDESDTSALSSGAAYIFSRTGSAWSQEAYIKASNTEAQDSFGGNLSLSGDGSTLAVSASLEDSSSSGINGDQSNNDSDRAGAVYVFKRDVSDWTQEAYIKANNTDAFDEFGSSVSLSNNGDMLAVGSIVEDGFTFGIGGDEYSNIATNAGAAYVFTRNDGVWSQLAYIKSSSPGIHDWFGISVSISDSGDTLAVGASNEDGSGTSLGNNEASNAGAVYLY